MADTRVIRGDLDKVYDNPDATCLYISSYIYSKGDISTNRVSNKFCNLEVLSHNGLYYYVKTSGRLGAEDNNIIVRRVNSEVYVRKSFDEECKKMKREGYFQVEVISIYPNCSAAAKKFVSEKNVLSTGEAKEIQDGQQDKIERAKEAGIIRKRNVSKDTGDKLDPKVAQLVKNLYYEASAELKNVKKSLNPELFQNDNAPLGMINHRMIERGRDILDNIGMALNSYNSVKRDSTKMKYMEQIANYSNMYNSTIPRVLKSGTDTWLLNTADKLMEQFDLLDMLEIGLSNAVLNSGRETAPGVIQGYEALNSDISLVTDKKVINDIIEKMRIEQLHNHNFKTRLINAFEVNQKNAPSFNSSCGNVVSLFHGTRSANIVSILSTNIKLPHNLGPNVAITGHMFGSGIYFGKYSKSLQYANARFGGPHNKSKKLYIFLCEVALGRMEFLTSPCNYSQAPKGYDSVMGVGQDNFKEGLFIKGVGSVKDFKIPRSTIAKACRSSAYSLLHDEFIVYRQDRFRIKYILELEAA